MSVHSFTRRCVTAAVAAVALGAVAAQPATATSNLSTQIAGWDDDKQQKVWFNTDFDTQPRAWGKVRGRVQLATETTARLDGTRRITSADRGEIDAGLSIPARLTNEPVSSRLRVTARPTLQLLFEWQPEEDPYACNNTTFPTFPGDEWFVRTDGGGNLDDGFCGAIEITADDLNRLPGDLDLPEVFEILDQHFDAGYGGTQPISQTNEIVEIKVCKMIATAFGFSLGDFCNLELNAEVDAPLTTVAHTLDAQMCTDAQAFGPCLHPFGAPRALTFSDPSQSFSTKAPCPDSRADVDVEVSNPAWDARVDDVTVGLSLDFNVHIRPDGDGVDILTIELPGSISLLNEPLPLHIDYPDAGRLHVADVTPDDDPPFVALDPAQVTIDEGSSATFSPTAIDLCTPPEDLSSIWTIDGASSAGATLTRTYDNDKPTPFHSGSLTVSDARHNKAAAVPVNVTVRNVPPAIDLAGLPAEPIAVGTQASLSAGVTDPGADLMTWSWSFGDGQTAGRSAGSVQDRADSRSHAYTRAGEYLPQVAIADGTDQRTAGGKIVAFNPKDKLEGTASYIAEDSSLGVPVGSSYSLAAKVEYPKRAVRPSGKFTADFLLIEAGGRPQPGGLEATSYEWLFDYGTLARVQGFGTVNGAPGWKFLAEVSRDAHPKASRATVTLWRPGFSTVADPEYRFGGPRKKGHLH